MADAQVSKTCGANTPCRFDPDPRHSMTIQVKPQPAEKFDGDTLIAPTTGGNDVFFALAKDEGFEAKPGELALIHPPGYAAKRMLVVGLGKKQDLTPAGVLSAIAAGARRAQALGAKRVGCVVSEELASKFGSARTGELAAVASTLGSYAFLTHKSDRKTQEEKRTESFVLLASAGRLAAMAEGASRGIITASAVCMTRDLVNEPPSVTTPTYLGAVARDIAKKSPKIAVEVAGREEIARLGMGGLLGIARGSDEEPKFIRLTYRGGGRKTIVLVGKGITFDTGGLSLKGAEHMETMKLDMAGAATILGIFSVLPQLSPKATIIGLIPATENMPGPKAIKPGDVVTMMNGKTVEILNTDAEGRMVLGDALSFATAKLRPDAVIDFATLTGACMVALGQDIAGLFGTNEALLDALKKSADETGELLWQMPLAKEYKELLKSPVADLKNIAGGRYGGAITAALFLSEFVGEGIPWAHLDVAGPAFAEKDTPLTPRGGTGYAVRLTLEYLQKL